MCEKICHFSHDWLQKYNTNLQNPEKYISVKRNTCSSKKKEISELPSKHKTFVYYLYNVGSTSSTFVRHCTNVIQMRCVCWVSALQCVYSRPRLLQVTATHLVAVDGYASPVAQSASQLVRNRTRGPAMTASCTRARVPETSQSGLDSGSLLKQNVN